MTDIFEYAMQMERDGEDYYRQLARQTANRGLRTILTTLADEEVKHYNILQKIKTTEPQIAETTILTDAKNVFVRIKESNEGIDSDIGQTELYKKAQDIEQRSRNFYLEKADEVEEQYQREIFRELAEEEKKHYFLLVNFRTFAKHLSR